MAEDGSAEDYPHEIDEQLKGFESSVSSVTTMLQTLMGMNRNDLLQKVGNYTESYYQLLSRIIEIFVPNWC